MAHNMNQGENGAGGGRTSGDALGRPGDHLRVGDDVRVADDILWTAYQYTADELPEPAARAFEAALESNQQAREALAEAVALGDTIRAALGREGVTAPAVMPASLVASSVGASAQSNNQGASNRNASYGWAAACVAFGAAACLALTMALRSAPHVDTPAPIAERPAAKTDGRDVKPDGLADHLLLAVLFPEESADLAVIDAGSTPIVGAYKTDTDNSVVADDDVIYEPMPDAAAPDWLIAAVVEGGAPANE